MWPIPLIFNVHNVLRNDQVSKKWPILLKMADSAESARGIGHFKIATFSRLSGTSFYFSFMIFLYFKAFLKGFHVKLVLALHCFVDYCY